MCQKPAILGSPGAVFPKKAAMDSVVFDGFWQSIRATEATGDKMGGSALIHLSDQFPRYPKCQPIPGHSLTPAGKSSGSTKIKSQRGGRSSTVMLNCPMPNLEGVKTKSVHPGPSPVGSKIQSS